MSFYRSIFSTNSIIRNALREDKENANIHNANSPDYKVITIDGTEDIKTDNAVCENKKGILKKIHINTSCINCGVCALLSNYIKENIDGSVSPIGTGIIANNDIADFEKVIMKCPTQALVLVNGGNTDASGVEGLFELKKMIIAKYSNFKFPLPDPEEYKFIKEEYKIPTPVGSREWRYDYNSEKNAMRAGLEEFNRIMYSQLRVLIQQVLVQYKSKYIKKYTEYIAEEGNYYFDINEKISNLLKSLVVEIEELSSYEIRFPEEFVVCKAEPTFGMPGDKISREMNVYQISHLEESWVTDSIIRGIESLSWYDAFVNTDEMSRYVNNRERDMYSYDLREVTQLLSKHILDEVAYVLNSSDSMKEIMAKNLRGVISEIEKEVNNKFKYVLSSIDNYLQKHNIEYLHNEKKENNINKQVKHTAFSLTSFKTQPKIVQWKLDKDFPYKWYVHNGLLYADSKVYSLDSGKIVREFKSDIEEYMGTTTYEHLFRVDNEFVILYAKADYCEKVFIYSDLGRTLLYVVDVTYDYGAVSSLVLHNNKLRCYRTKREWQKPYFIYDGMYYLDYDLNTCTLGNQSKKIPLYASYDCYDGVTLSCSDEEHFYLYVEKGGIFTKDGHKIRLEKEGLLGYEGKIELLKLFNNQFVATGVHRNTQYKFEAVVPNGYLAFYSVEGGQPKKVIKLHDQIIRDFVLIDHFLVSCDDNSLKVWDNRSFTQISEFNFEKLGKKIYPRQIVVDNEKGSIVVKCQDNELIIFD